MKNYTLYTSLILLTLLSWAFLPAEITTTIEGNVLNLDKGIFDVEVYVLNKSGENTGYYEPTDQNGKYLLRFNATEGNPIQLKFEKKGYSTFIREHIPHRGSKKRKLENIHLFKLDKKINLYPSQKAIDYKTYETNKIDYFSFIKKEAVISEVKINQEIPISGYWYEITFHLKNNNEKHTGWWFKQSLDKNQTAKK